MRKYNVVFRYSDGTSASVFTWGHFQRENIIWAKEKIKSNVKIEKVELYYVKRDIGKHWISGDYYERFNKVAEKHHH